MARKPKLTPEQKRNHHLWFHTALLHGFNQMCRLTTDLNERAACRAAALKAEHELALLGVPVHEGPGGTRGPKLGMLPRMVPPIPLYETDVELLREIVRQYDERKAAPEIPFGPPGGAK